MTTNPHPTSSCCSTTATEPASGRENSPVVNEAPIEHQHGYISDKQAYLRRMSRIEGQARGVSKMIADEKYCIDILTQVSALTRALQSVATGLLDDHLKHCVLDAAKLSDDEAAIKLQEASDAIARFIRS
ncbi:metal-sensitive transcriptional regulator [Dietzia sp. NPDC055340]|uniref:metal-sensitive transcriptional regulator n=1 Tax=Arthrobacter koreensis TaxID=199136 RepID=UPI00366EC5BB